MRRDDDYCLPGWKSVFLALVLSGCLACGGGPAADCRESGLQAVVEATAGVRLLEPRLVGGFSHAPCVVEGEEQGRLLPSFRCRSAPDQVLRDRWLRAGGTMRDCTDPSLRGVWRLLWAENETGVAGAVAELRRGAEQTPGAERLNDLAAALLSQARMEQDPRLLVEALDLLERALEEKPRLPEARFNRALVLSDLGLVADAANAWRRAAEVESVPGWRREAEERSRSVPVGGVGEPFPASSLTSSDPGLVQAAVRQDRQQARELAMDVLLPEWAESVLADAPEIAADRLEVLRSVGSALESMSGDGTVSGSVAAIDRVSAEGADALARLARAHQELGRGRERLRQSRYTDSYEHLEAARDALAASGSPLAGWAELGMAAADTTTQRWRDAVARVDRMLAAGGLEALPVLEARCRWARGLVELRTGDYEASLSSFLAAARLLRQAGEPALEGGALALSAESYRSLGREREAWEQRVRALRRLSGTPGGSLHNLLLDASDAARGGGFHRAAIVFQTRGVAEARHLGSASREVEALLGRSRIASAAGWRERARRDLEQAGNRIRQVADDQLRRRLAAELEEAAARAALPDDPRDAVRRLGRALDFYSDLGFTMRTSSLLRDRARVLLDLGDRTAAKADLEASVRQYERWDLQPLGDLFRREHFEQGQESFEMLIGILLDEGEALEALAFSERARMAATLRSREADRRLRGGDPVRPPGPATPLQGRDLLAASHQLAGSRSLVEYLVLPDRLVVWRLAAGELRVWERRVGRDEVEERVEALTSALRWGGPPELFADQARRMYRLLLQGVVDDLPPGSDLVVVPDRLLASVPFAALVDPATGRFLLEDRAVASALGLVDVLAADRPAGPGQSSAGSVLLAGDPSSPEPRLEGARGELRDLALLYPGAQLLVGEGVRKERLLTALASSSIVHYAGHGVDDPDNPWRSYLPLASSGNGASRLYAHDIRDLELPELRLAVLAACGTARGRSERTIPVSGLTLALLEAGAAQVLSSLWEVEDGVSRELLVAFHRHHAAGVPAPEALRRAILEDLSDFRERPAAWAPWVLFLRGDLAREEAPLPRRP